MSRVRHITGVHEKTVKDAERHAAAHAKPRARNQRAPRMTVTTIYVDPRVWAKAKELAGGDLTRIVVQSETSVLVVNQGKERPRPQLRIV